MKRADDWDADERAALVPMREELAAIEERHRDDPSLELLRAARADALHEPLNDAVADHLEHSAWSRALVEGADEADVALDAVTEDRILARVRIEAGRQRPGRRWSPAWLWAPALAAAAVAVTVIVLRTPRAANQTAAVSVSPPSTPESSRPATAAPSTPAFLLALDKPEVRFTANALVLRGSADGPKFVDVVAPGIRAYRGGDYAAAARELAALQSRYPNSVEIFFYLGVSRLFLGDAEGGRAALEEARRVSDESFAPAVDWYLAVADERAGRLSDAHAALTRLCGSSSEFRQKACGAAARIGSR